MAFADDLLEQAQHLARREKKRPRQASLRRAVSTAYYSLFHLLTNAAVANWKQAGHRAALARAFDHSKMKAASGRLADLHFPGQDPATVAHLRNVAISFRRLQDSRHTADYDNATHWSRTDVITMIDLAVGAFRSWRVIRKEQVAQDYLLSMLVKER